MLMKKNKRVLCLLLVILVGYIFSFSFNETHWETGGNNTWLDTWHKIDVKKQEVKKKDIVRIFCDTLTWEADTDTIQAEKQSIFLALLCNNGTKKEWFFEIEGSWANTFIKKEFSYKKAKFQSENCKKEYSEKCNVAELADNLITLVLSEMFTVREATAFSVRWNVKAFSSKEKLEARKNKYIKTYLWIDAEIEKYCAQGWRHKGTCKMIENHIKSFKKAFKKLQIIDIDELYKIDEEYETAKIKCSDKNDKANKKINSKDYMIYCGLVWEEEWGLNMFVNLIYNELQWYAVFSTYYWQILSQREEIVDSIRSEYLQSFAWPKKFVELTEETISDLNDITVTFPIHVVLTAFQEDLLYVRDKYLVKLVTPFYCLYHKLRNVQFNK